MDLLHLVVNLLKHRAKGRDLVALVSLLCLRESSILTLECDEVMRGGQRFPSQDQLAVHGPEVRTRALLLNGKTEAFIARLNSHPDRRVPMSLEEPENRPLEVSSDTQDAQTEMVEKLEGRVPSLELSE